MKALLILTTIFLGGPPVVTVIDFTTIEACNIAVQSILNGEKWDRDRAASEMAARNATSQSGNITVQSLTPRSSALHQPVCVLR